jgi:glutathione peroxidase
LLREIPMSIPIDRIGFRVIGPALVLGLLIAAFGLHGHGDGGEPAEKAPEGGKKESAPAGPSSKKAPPALDFTVKDIDGKDVPLGSYLGKGILVVNVASRCGLTDKQYAGLEKLYGKYKGRGLEILAFPANDFRKQEPGSESEIKSFCAGKGVTFKLFSKICVKGESIHPLYKFLTSKETGGKFAGEIEWNFGKFLIDRSGKVVARFAPPIDPMSKEVVEAVEGVLGPAAAGAKKAEGKPEGKGGKG